MTGTSKPNPDYVKAPVKIVGWTPDCGPVIWKEVRREGDTVYLEGLTEDGQKLRRAWRYIPDNPENGVFRPADWKGEHDFHRCSHLKDLTDEVETLKNELHRRREDAERESEKARKEREATAAQVIVLRGGIILDIGEACKALDEAMRIIEAVGTPGSPSRVRSAGKWMKRYFPNRA